MLKKLMKYEWKAVRNVLLIINSFTVLSTAFGVIAINSLLSGQDTKGALPDLTAILLFLIYYATIIGVSFAMMIYIGIRFYRNLYTDEGYLMHTLPVTGRQLVVSRLIVHSGCMLLTGVLICASIVVLLLPIYIASAGENPSYVYSALYTEFRNAFGFSLPRVLVCGTTAIIISTASGILAVYCAISLGQLFRRHRIMGSILCYIALSFLVQTLTTILMMPQMLLSMSGGSLNLSVYFSRVFLTTSIVSLFLGIAYYLITLYLMNHNLNLD